MKNVRDQLAKGILKAALNSVTTMETAKEIPGHILTADVWVQPNPGFTSEQGALGVLGQMVALGPCLIEPFSGVPSASEVRSCVLKQYSLNHSQCRDANTAGKSAPPFPRLWVLSHGSPDSVIKAMRLQQMEGWPEGCFVGRPFDPFHLVVLRKLPKTAETLLLRLMRGDKTFREATGELKRASETAPELAAMMDEVFNVFVEFSGELDQDQLEEDDMEDLRNIKGGYEEWKRIVKAEGNREALIKAIQTICKRCEIELTEERLAQLENCELEQLESLVVEIGLSRQWPL